jgi:hypothetical protein
LAANFFFSVLGDEFLQQSPECFGRRDRHTGSRLRQFVLLLLVDTTGGFSLDRRLLGGESELPDGQSPAYPTRRCELVIPQHGPGIVYPLVNGH